MIGFFAFEAGAAAAMAPVWTKLQDSARVGLSEVASRHVRMRPDVKLVEEVGDVSGWIEGLDVVLLSATGRPSEGAVLSAAGDRRVPVIQLVDTWGPYRPRFAHGIAPLVAVVDDAARREAMEDGIDPDRLVVAGQPAWEAVGERPSYGRGTVFVSQPVRSLYGDRLGFDECTALDLLRDMRRADPSGIGPLTIVPHPAGDDASPEGDERSADLAEALDACDTVCGMFSSAMVDALLAGRTVISLQPGGKAADPCPLSRHGRIARCATVADGLEALSKGPADRAGLARTLAGSAERFAGLLQRAAERGSAA